MASDEPRLGRERWRAHRAVHRAERRALEAAYQELQRRLNDLNHAHQQMQDRDKEYVRYDTWNTAHDNLTEKIDLVNAGCIELRSASGGTEKQKQDSRATVALWISAISTSVAVAAVLILSLH